MTRSEWLAILATWPDSAREAWGLRSNSLTPPGLAGWREAEARAFDEVSARLVAGEFREVAPQHRQLPGNPTTRRAPAPGQAGLGFDHRKGA